jgi:hypothetical protein
MYKTVLRIEKSLYGATVNAQKFETAFYANPDLRNVQPIPEPAPAQLDLNALVAQLQENPELLATLSQLLGGNQVIRAAV